MLAENEPWVAEAACRGLAETLGGRERDRLFYPTRGEPTKRAREMCADCPVRQECLDFALRNGMHYGIWGGTSERERRRMRREMGITPIKHGTVGGYDTHKNRGEDPCWACTDAMRRDRVASYHERKAREVVTA